jgi:hypothetical protein
VTTTTTAYVYIGDGSAFVPQVGARDLTQEEFNALSMAVKEHVLACGLYQPITLEAEDNADEDVSDEDKG